MFLHNFSGIIVILIILIIGHLFGSGNFALPFVLYRGIIPFRVLILSFHTGLFRVTFGIWIFIFGTRFLEGLWATFSFLIYLLLFAKEEYIIYRGKG